MVFILNWYSFPHNPSLNSPAIQYMVYIAVMNIFHEFLWDCPVGSTGVYWVYIAWFNFNLTGLCVYIFRHLHLELLTQFPASNDEKYVYLPGMKNKLANWVISL